MVITTRCNRPQKPTYFSFLFPTATLQPPEVSFIAFKLFWSPAWLDVRWSDFHSDQMRCAGNAQTKLAQQPCSKAWRRQELMQHLIWNNAWLPRKETSVPVEKALTNSRTDMLLWQFQTLQRIKLLLSNFSSSFALGFCHAWVASF